MPNWCANNSITGPRKHRTTQNRDRQPREPKEQPVCLTICTQCQPLSTCAVSKPTSAIFDEDGTILERFNDPNSPI